MFDVRSIPRRDVPSLWRAGNNHRYRGHNNQTQPRREEQSVKDLIGCIDEQPHEEHENYNNDETRPSFHSRSLVQHGRVLYSTANNNNTTRNQNYTPSVSIE